MYEASEQDSASQCREENAKQLQALSNENAQLAAQLDQLFSEKALLDSQIMSLAEERDGLASHVQTLEAGEQHIQSDSIRDLEVRYQQLDRAQG